MRAPWWHWALFSLGGLLISAAAVLAGLVALAFLGVDFTDYLELSRPPLIQSGLVGGLIALVIAGQKLGLVLMIRLFRPAAVVALQGLAELPDPAGTARRLGLGVLLFAGLQAVWHLVGSAAPAQWNLVGHLAYAVGRGGHGWAILWFTAALALIGPVAEELIYRGLLFRLIRRRWGFAAGATLSAIAFGLPHGPAAALPATLMGLYFAWQAERDQSLAGAIGLHILNNLAAVALLLSPYR